MMNIGDINLGDTFDFGFTTVDSTGLPTTLAGSPAVAAYPGNSTTEVTAGITLSVDFDSRTGLHNVRVVATTGNGYATATNYKLVVTAGTVGGVSIVGYVVGHFSIENRSALRPTAAGRTLDVSTTGESGLDFDNIKDATGAHTLTNIRVPNVTLVDTTTTNTDMVTAGSIRTAVGLASANLDTQLTAIDDYIDTEVAAIKAKTDNLPSDPADASDIAAAFSTVNATLSTIAAYVDTEVAAIKAKTDSLTFSGSNLVVKLADGVTHGGGTALMRLGSSSSTPAFYVTNSGGDAVHFVSTASEGIGLFIEGNQTDGDGIKATGGNSGVVIVCEAATGSGGLVMVAFDPGVPAWAAYGGGPAFSLIGGGGDPSIYAPQGISSDLLGKVTGAGSATITGTGARAQLSSDGIDLILPAEPSAAPTWGVSTLKQIFAWVAAFTINKVKETSTTQTLRNNADAADIATAPVSDDGTTATRGKFS